MMQYIFDRFEYQWKQASVAGKILVLAILFVGIPFHHEIESAVFPTIEYERTWVTVKAGDTYWNLCKEYGNDDEVRNTMAVSRDENLKAGTDLNNLQVGETIVIYRRIAN